MVPHCVWAQLKRQPEQVEEDEGPRRAEPLQGPPHPSMLIAHEERDLLCFVLFSFFSLFSLVSF